MSLDLSGLNPVQREAVLHGEGPLLLLAGAGSGKTRVVTHRIAYLIEQGAHPATIQALTFTNRAAREMKIRVEGLLGGPLHALSVSTFHSLGARVLRRYADEFGRTSSFTIYDDKDQLELIWSVLDSAGIEVSAALVKAIQRCFDRAKNAGGNAADAAPPGDHLLLDMTALGRRYDEHLARSNAFDFGDLIVRPAELLQKNEAVRADFQARWRWVLVDEFQDTNAAQFKWIQGFAPPSSNLFVVGDDDQSIYGWRGAEVENILEFPTRYPRARVLKLEQNYRSDGHILAGANGVIAKNRRRLGKALWTDGDDGMQIDVQTARDGRAEAIWIAGQIQALCSDEGYQAGDIAVLLRANYLSLDLEEMLPRVGLPYTVVRGRSFYDRAEVRDALAYIRVLVNPSDDVGFARAVNAPKRGVGKTSLKRLSIWAGNQGSSLWEAAKPAAAKGIVKGRAKAGIARFMEIIEAAQAQDGPTAQMKYVLEASGLLAAAELDDEDTQLGNLGRLVDAIARFEDETEGATLSAYLETVKLVSELDHADLSGGAVQLMTIHAAKGLEFPVVFVPGMEEGIFPSRRSVEADAVEEERRLCYVAITRAERRLILSRAQVRRTFGEQRANEPSRFLTELPPDALSSRVVFEAPAPRRRRRRARPDLDEFVDAGPSVDDLCCDVAPDDFGGVAHSWAPGVQVYHSNLGVGTIREVSIGHQVILRIEFPGIGVRKIVADYVSLYEG